MNALCFGQKLKSARKRMGLTQKQLGEKTGAGQVVIANYERGARFPGEDMLRNLAEVLHVSLDYLLSVQGTSKKEEKAYSFDTESFGKLLVSEPLERIWTYLKLQQETRHLNAEDIYTQLFIPLLRKTGDSWFKGQISIYDEHLVSAKIRELIPLVALNDKKSSNQVKPGYRWMGITAPGEKHDLALLMTSHLLQLSGWNALFLGTQLPVNDLIDGMLKFKPQILGISITSRGLLQGLEPYLRVLSQEIPYPYGIIVGGAAIVEENIEAYPRVIGISTNLQEGIDMAEAYIEKKGALQ